MIHSAAYRSAFLSYVKAYDESNPKIKLKVIHTFRVAENCERVARSLFSDEEEIELSHLIGILHDIGRFEQVSRFGTFVDAESVDHAEFGADLLFKDGLIKRFTDNEKDYPLIECAIRQHNKFRLSTGLDDRTLLHSKIIRDADKADIFRVIAETPEKDIFGITKEEIENTGVSDDIREIAMNADSAIKRRPGFTPADRYIAHICLANEIVFLETKKIIGEQGYLSKLLDVSFSDGPTQEVICTLKNKFL